MLITKIEPSNNKRYRVFGDDTFLFALYKKELKQYSIIEGDNVDETIISSILDEIIFKRAKERSLYLLEKRAMSTSMIHDKLKQNDYSEGIIKRVIQFLQEYGYLNDLDFIRMYVESYCNKKSKRQIIYDLTKKGIERNDIDTFFYESNYSERVGFDKIFQRYIRGKDLQDVVVRQKTFRYLLGKGFPISMIKEAIKDETKE